MERRSRVLMFGPDLGATSGISNVVNNWLQAGLRDDVELEYISTLDNYVQGQYLIKTFNALRAYIIFFLKSFRHVDLVHIHLSFGMSFYRKLPILMYSKLRGFKTVIHLHGSSFMEFYEDGPTIQKKLIQWLFNRTDAVFVLSKAWKEFIEGISYNTNIYTIYNGAILDQFSEGVHSEEGISIAFMGRLGRRKGTYDLLEAFKRLSSQVPQAHLVLGGDGEVEQVCELVAKNNMEKRVKVLGWVSGKEKIDVFNEADVYVLPSYNEGLPGSILEAMAASTPIVSTPVGGISEAVIEGQNGYLINPGDVDGLYRSLLILCQDKKMRVAMGKRSREIIECHFNIEKIVDEITDTYDKLILEK